jgi:hypothetical protein
MELINRESAVELAYKETQPPAGRRPPLARPLTRLERFEVAKQRMRAFVLFSLGTAGAASLLIYGAYVMTTRILL